MEVVKVTSETFETEVLKSKEPVLIDFLQIGVDHVKCYHQ